jgi:hypothetical protein
MTATPSTTPPTPTEATPKLYGLLAEFRDVEALLTAARAVRDAGYRRWDVYSPFPVHGMEEAMGRRATILPWVCLGGGITGMLGALAMVWWTNALAGPAPMTQLQGFPFIISGKPLFSLPADLPVVFELTILLSAFSAGLGMLALNGLPCLYHPLFSVARFRGVTDDKLFIAVEARDERFDLEATRALLEALGAAAVETVTE